MDNHIIRLCGREIERPGHICAFFESPQQELETLVTYFRDGLAAGEQLLHVVENDRAGERIDAFRGARLPIGDDGVTVLGADETYLATGRFEMDRMVTFIQESLVNARALGKRVRTCGAMSWLKQKAPGTERAMEYEARMNLLVPKFDCTFMCTYQLEQLSGETMVDIMATHPYVILKGEIRENKFYIPPDRYLAELLGPQSVA